MLTKSANSEQFRGLADLLAPCNQCPSVTDKELSFRSADNISVFQTLNGSRRYLYKVNGRNVAALLIKTEPRGGVIANFYTLPDYQGAGFLRDLYRVALYQMGAVRIGRSLAGHPQTAELIETLAGA